MRLPPDDEIKKMLSLAKTLAIIGCSEKSWRTSNHIGGLMQEKGLRMKGLFTSKIVV